MKLQQLLNIHGRIDWRDQKKDFVPDGIFFDSRKVSRDSIFVAIRGESSDGHRYLGDVAKKEAAAIIVEDVNGVPDFYKGAVVEVLDTRLTLQVLSQRFYDSPGDQMTSIAVTGTNGKTSFSYILEHMLNSLNHTCGVIGTIDHHVENKKWESQLTTPDPVTLQNRLKDFLEFGAQSFVIEASSHALKQERIKQGIDICVFTNLTRDHMDYHKDEEDYFRSKAKLFSRDYKKEGKDTFAIINGDDPYGQRLGIISERDYFFYGQDPAYDYCFQILESSLDATKFSLTFPNKKTYEFSIPLIGVHNVYNTVAALACIYTLEMDYKRAIMSMRFFNGIPGRLQVVPNHKRVYAFVDYAHTDDALRKVLTDLRKIMGKGSGKKLICVFGCGGDRDQGKRQFMGKVATDLADMVIVTSDNPRTEDPNAIIDDIVDDFTKSSGKIITEVDRAKAIELGVSQARMGDVLLVAGKGHESYQDVGGKRIEFSDVDQLNKAFGVQIKDDDSE